MVRSDEAGVDVLVESLLQKRDGGGDGGVHDGEVRC